MLNDGAQAAPSLHGSLPTSSSTERSPLLQPEQESRHVPIDGSLPEASGHSNKTNDAQNGTRQLNSDGGHEHSIANQSITFIRGTFVTIALTCLVLLQATNISMLTTTQSQIAEDLDAFEKTSWFTSVYLIAMSALAPINGKLSSVFSPRTCIFTASILLAAGALICAWAQTFEVFLLGRTVTGIGASGVFTISIIVVLELSGPKRKGIAIGTLNSGYTVGVAAGATIAGAAVDVRGWRALFWMQCPIAVLAGVILLLAIPHEFTAGKQDRIDAERTTWQRISRIDYLGAITLTGSLVLLLYALSAPKSIPVLPIVLSVVVGVLFVLVESYWASDPIIPVSLLKHRGLLLTCIGTVGFMMARWSVLFFTPTYAIAVRQWLPSVAGSLLIPTNGGFAVGGLLVGALHIKRNGSFYIPTLVTYAVFPVTLVLLATMAHQSQDSPAGFVIVLFTCGFATGAALNYNLAHLLHLTPTSTHYVATALIATFRGFAGSFGTAVGGGLFTRTLSSSLKQGFSHHGLSRDPLIRKLLGSPVLVGHLSGVEREVAVRGYEDALKTLWLGAAILALAMVLVQAGVGYKGHDEKIEEDAERQALLDDDQNIIR